MSASLAFVAAFYLTYFLVILVLAWVIDKIGCFGSLINELSTRAQTFYFTVARPIQERRMHTGNYPAWFKALNMDIMQTLDDNGLPVSQDAVFRRRLLFEQVFWGINIDDMCARYGAKILSLCLVPKVALGDYLYSALNYHSVLGMFASDKANPYTRMGKRIAYFVQHATAFCVTVAMSAYLKNSLYQTVFSIFVVSPASLLFNRMLYLVLTCPCFEIGRNTYFSAMRCTARCVGLTLALPFFALGIAFLVIAAYVTVHSELSYSSLISRYFWQVHVLASAMDGVRIAKDFVFTEKCTKVTLLCSIIPLLTLGSWSTQRLQVYHVQDNSVERTSTKCFCGLFGFHTTRLAKGVAPSEAFAVPPPLSDEELARSYQNSSLKTSLLPTAAAASAAIEQTSATIDQAFTSMYQAAQNYRLPWQKTNAV